MHLLAPSPRRALSSSAHPRRLPRVWRESSQATDFLECLCTDRDILVGGTSEPAPKAPIWYKRSRGRKGVPCRCACGHAVGVQTFSSTRVAEQSDASRRQCPLFAEVVKPKATIFASDLCG
eukprot:694911-Rhodomonas_salina.2